MRELQDDEGNPTDWAYVDPELLYGSQGWCEADEPKHHCPCVIDGLTGPTCEEPTGDTINCLYCSLQMVQQGKLPVLLSRCYCVSEHVNETILCLGNETPPLCRDVLSQSVQRSWNMLVWILQMQSWLVSGLNVPAPRRAMDCTYS